MKFSFFIEIYLFYEILQKRILHFRFYFALSAKSISSTYICFSSVGKKKKYFSIEEKKREY
jgi:hypothetical protein